MERCRLNGRDYDRSGGLPLVLLQLHKLIPRWAARMGVGGKRGGGGGDGIVVIGIGVWARLTAYACGSCMHCGVRSTVCLCDRAVGAEGRGETRPAS